MVDLFEKGALDYLICTPTLLEGVNLPAKNIFLFSDRYGGATGKEKHSALSFWNLLGRAGRITFGLSGNVYCIEGSIEKYKELLDNKDVEINDPEIEVMDNATRRKYLIDAFIGTDPQKYEYLKSKGRADIEYLIFELLTKSHPESLLRGLDDEEIKSQLLNEIVHIRETLQIPLYLMNMNPGIDPRLQNQLYTVITNLDDELIHRYFRLVSNPRTLYASDFSEFLTETARNLRWPKDRDIPRISNRLTQWIHEFPLSDFIQQRLQHSQLPTDIDSQIAFIETALETIQNLENEFSYNAPKYLKCFFDMVINVANQNGTNTEVYKEQIDAFLFTLECGISKPVGKYLYEKGVSRPVAIKASALVEDLATIPLNDNFFRQRKVVDRLKSGISSIAYQELMDHLEWWD
jgi:hypothetical protein